MGSSPNNLILNAAQKGAVLQFLFSYCGAGDAPQIGDQRSFIAAVSNGVFSNVGFREHSGRLVHSKRSVIPTSVHLAAASARRGGQRCQWQTDRGVIEMGLHIPVLLPDDL